MKVLLLLLLPCLALAQNDTIPISVGHQKQLPELIAKSEQLEQEQKRVSELLMTIVLAYLKEEDFEALKENRVTFSDDRKNIVILPKKEEK